MVNSDLSTSDCAPPIQRLDIKLILARVQAHLRSMKLTAATTIDNLQVGVAHVLGGQM